jgi:prephenate dehydratase
MLKNIGYLGPVGSFSHEAAESLFRPDLYRHTPLTSIPDVISAVDKGSVDLGVVPVENAIEGSVTATLDWLVHQVDLPIVAEFLFPISQCIVAHPAQKNTPANKIKKIMSHPQAIAQCRVYLKEKYPQAEWVFTDSTSQAAKIVADSPNEPWLAIGARQAAVMNELDILESHAEDHPNNVTRFIVISKSEDTWSKDSKLFKTSLQVTLPKDYPGALYQVLASFSWRKINLTHIESRPTKTGIGNYFFLIDADLPVEHVLLKGCIEEIEAIGCKIRVLGSYPCFSFLEKAIH